MISQHIKALNHIYANVMFNGKYKHRNIRFEVQRIKVRIVAWVRKGYRSGEMRRLMELR